MKILETKRLTIRQVNSEDSAFILTLLNEPAYIQNIGDRGIRTLEQAREYIADKLISSYKKHGFGLYLAELKETEESIGFCGLIKRDALDDVDIGYAFLSQHRGKGYATESALAVRDYARETVGLKRLVGITDPANTGSVRVLEKLGLRFEKMIKLSEDDIDLSLFSIDFD